MAPGDENESYFSGRDTTAVGMTSPEGWMQGNIVREGARPWNFRASEIRDILAS